jgi:hypothetical protein
VGDRSANDIEGLFGPANEDDDDVFDFKPPPGPSLRERRRRAEEAGDVEALLQEIRNKPAGFLNLGEMYRHVERACQVGARTDPEGFAKEMLGRVAGFNAYLCLRLQNYVAARLAGHDAMMRAAGRDGHCDFPPDLAERLLPRLTEVQRSLAEVLAVQAQVHRSWALTRAKEERSGRPAGAKPAARRRSRKASPPGANGSVPHNANGRPGGPPDGARARKGGGRRRG